MTVLTQAEIRARKGMGIAAVQALADAAPHTPHLSSSDIILGRQLAGEQARIAGLKAQVEAVGGALTQGSDVPFTSNVGVWSIVPADLANLQAGKPLYYLGAHGINPAPATYYFAHGARDLASLNAQLAAAQARGNTGIPLSDVIKTAAEFAAISAAVIGAGYALQAASMSSATSQAIASNSAVTDVPSAMAAAPAPITPGSLTDALTQQVLSTGTTLPTGSLAQAATDAALGAGGSTVASSGSLLDTLYQGAQQALTKIGTGIVQNAAATVTSAEMAKLIPKPTPPKPVQAPIPVQAPMPAAQPSHGFGAIAVGLLAVVAAVKFGLLAA